MANSLTSSISEDVLHNFIKYMDTIFYNSSKMKNIYIKLSFKKL